MTTIKYNSEDLINHHGVSAIIKNKNQEILIQEHVKYGFFTIPVGKVKTNQSIENGLKQEVYEECNIKVKEMKKITNKIFKYIRNGKEVYVNMHLFEIIKYSGKIINKEKDKHNQQKFMSIEEIKKLPYLSDTTLLYLYHLGFTRKAIL